MNVFELLAHPIRHRIVTVLASGEHTSGNIVDVITHEFRVSRAAVFWHLAILRDNAFVTVRADWREHWYRLDERLITQLRGQLDELAWRWKHRIGHRENTDPMALFTDTRRESYTQGWRNDLWRT